MNFKCPECEEAFASKDALVVHIPAVHEKIIFYCPIEGCKRYFGASAALNFHMTVNHRGISDFKCDMCDVDHKFTEVLEFLEHIEQFEKHFGEMKAKCHKCNKMLLNGKYLSMHIRRENAKRDDLSYMCGLCHRLYLTKSELRMHELVHEKIAGEELDKKLAEIDFNEDDVFGQQEDYDHAYLYE